MKQSPLITMTLVCALAVLVPFANAQKQSMPLSLREAIALALEKNLRLEIERIQPQRSRLNIDRAKADFDPTFNLNPEYRERTNPRSAEQQAADGATEVKSRSTSVSTGINKKFSPGTDAGITARTSNSQTTFNSFESEFSSNVNLVIRQPLLKNAGTHVNLNSLRRAKKGVERADLNFLNRVEETIREVLFAYYDLLFAHANHESLLKALKVAEQRVKDNQDRVELGDLTPLDVSQARSELALRQSSVLQAELEISKAENQIKRLISNDIISLLETEIQLTHPLGTPRFVPLELATLQIGLENRKDYLAAIKLTEENELNLTFTKNQLLPQLDLNGSYGLSGLGDNVGDSWERISEGEADNWTIGVTLQIPWGMRREKANHTQALLDKKESLLTLKQLEQNIIVEINNATREVATAHKRYEANRIARIYSEQSAKSESEKFKEGISTTFVVLEIEKNLVDARTNELRSIVDFYKSMIQLQRTQGTLLADHGITIAPESEGSFFHVPSTPSTTLPQSEPSSSPTDSE